MKLDERAFCRLFLLLPALFPIFICAQSPGLSLQDGSAYSALRETSIDGKYILTLSGDVVETQRGITLFRGESVGYQYFLLPDDRHLLMLGSTMNQARVVDFIDNKIVHQFSNTTYGKTVFDYPSGRLVHYLSRPEEALRCDSDAALDKILQEKQQVPGFMLVDLPHGRDVRFIPCDLAVAFFSVENSRITTGGYSFDSSGASMMVASYTFENKETPQRFSSKAISYPYAYSISPDGEYIFCAATDKLSLIQTRTGKITQIPAEAAFFAKGYFLPDGKHLLVAYGVTTSGAWDLVLNLLQLPSGKSVYQSHIKGANIATIQISPDFREVFFARSGQWATDSITESEGVLQDILTQEKRYAFTTWSPYAAFSKNDRYFVYQDFDDTYKPRFVFINRKTGKKVKSFTRSQAYSFIPYLENRYRAAGKNIRLGHYSYDFGSKIKLTRELGPYVTQYAESGDGQICALSDYQTDLKRYRFRVDSVKNGKNLAMLWYGYPLSDFIYKVSISPEGRYVLYLKQDSTLVDVFMLDLWKREKKPVMIQKGIFNAQQCFWDQAGLHLYLRGFDSDLCRGKPTHGEEPAPDDQSLPEFIVKIDAANGQVRQCRYVKDVWTYTKGARALACISVEFRQKTKQEALTILDEDLQLLRRIELPEQPRDASDNPTYTILFQEVDQRLLLLSQNTFEGPIGARIFDLSTGKLAAQFDLPPDYKDNNFILAENYLVNLGNNGVHFFDLNTRKHCFRWIIFNEDEYIVITPENYYYTTRDAADIIRFTKGDASLPFRQYDLLYNRPDKVLAALPEPKAGLVEAYHKAYLKRLQKMGFREEDLSAEADLPVLKVTTPDLPFETDQNQLMLAVEVSDARFRLDRINVWVNDVPLYGRHGISLRGKNLSTWKENLAIPLSAGNNRIQLSCLNEKGVESLLEDVYISCNAPARKPDLYVLAIGVSEYADPAMNLRYAAKDAADVAALFKTRQQQYGNVFVKTLLNRDATAAQVRQLKNWLAQSGIDDHVVLFVSGHGLLDDNLDYYLATYDVDFSQPREKGIPYDALEDLLDGIPARQKLILMDACHSGELDKENVSLVKEQVTTSAAVTFRAVNTRVQTKQVGLQNSFELMKELFVDLRRGSGAAAISSAGGAEYAVEGDAWKNGVFTYSLLVGLREQAADMDKDGAVTVSELQHYLGQKVSELTQGQQRPTFRAENVTNDWRVW